MLWGAVKIQMSDRCVSAPLDTWLWLLEPIGRNEEFSLKYICGQWGGHENLIVENLIWMGLSGSVLVPWSSFYCFVSVHGSWVGIHWIYSFAKKQLGGLSLRRGTDDLVTMWVSQRVFNQGCSHMNQFFFFQARLELKQFSLLGL